MTSHNRRSFLQGGIGSVLGSALVAGRSVIGESRRLHKEGHTEDTKPPLYKIIYNWDGAPHGYSEFPQSLQQFLDKTFAPLENTQVGALFWCVGEHEASWKSETLPIVGDSRDRVYNSVGSMRHNENIRAMIARGENPFQAMVQRGHASGIDVYASIRMNDNHFRGLQLDDMSQTQMEGLTRLRKEHPEWCLGPERAPPWFAASWNMAIAEVREHRFRYIREVLALAEWDGVELDWQRHGFHLPADDAHRLRYTLTDLQRAVRQQTDAIGKKRGKQFHVAVRVATTLESCRRIGYDLPVWIQDNLCDIVTAGGGAGTDPGTEVEAFCNLIKNSPVHFYTGFDSGFWGTHEGLQPPRRWNQAWVRGTATGYWRRGADGMYAFNWHANERTRRDLLTTVGNHHTLEGTDKVFSAMHRYVADNTRDWTGADLNDRIHGQTPVALYRTLTGEGPTFQVQVHDEVARQAQSGQFKNAELHIEVRDYSLADKLAVSLDGKQLAKPMLRYVASENEDHPSDVSGASWLVWKLTPTEVDQGTHNVQVQLLERTPHLEPPLVVQHVEIHINYQHR